MLFQTKPELKLNFNIRIPRKSRIALFFSGSGSTVQAMLDQIEMENIVIAISSKKLAPGRIRAKRSGVAEKFFSFPADFDQVLEFLIQQKITAILLLGFMKFIPESFLKKWNAFGGSIYNIHPSLLPNFKGLNAFERSFEAKGDLGASIHVVWPELDAGPVLFRKKIISSDQIGKTTLACAKTWLRAGEQSMLRKMRSSFDPMAVADRDLL